MPAAGWCGGTFLKPEQGSDNHWYLPNVPSAASDLIFSAPLQAASSLCKQGVYPSAVLAECLEHFPMWVCYTWTRVWWPLAVAGWVSLLDRWVGGRHLHPWCTPRAWWAVGCGLPGPHPRGRHPAVPPAPGCPLPGSWMIGQLLRSPQGDLWHWQVTVWKCRLNTHMLSKTSYSETHLFWYPSFLWDFFY